MPIVVIERCPGKDYLSIVLKKTENFAYAKVRSVSQFLGLSVA